MCAIGMCANETLPMQQAHTQVRWSDERLGDFFLETTSLDHISKINGKEYWKFLKNEKFLVNLLEEVPLESRINMWFQQDGHPAHTAKATRMLLNKKFGNHWIGLRGPHEWPPRSPDLTPLDFFLWGHLKQQVYATRPASVEDLKDRIVRACRTISPQILRRVRSAILDRTIFCERMEGSHLEHMLWKYDRLWTYCARSHVDVIFHLHVILRNMTLICLLSHTLRKNRSKMW